MSSSPIRYEMCKHCSAPRHSIFLASFWQLDTPATLGCESDNVTIADKRVVFQAQCKEKRKNFELLLDLKETIVPEVSEDS